MKKLISTILLIVALFFALIWVNSQGEGEYDKKYQVIVVDGCEYLYKAGVYRESIAHKGNCKYCAQRDSINEQRQEYERQGKGGN